ncbi:MarR family winged helix-turn-helix transcriptional regulator [Acinetobacter sp. ANC 3813]|uniref:MarR family winged helix-turn-helix transcriptional regulator n=1 Tax=Acinetobacter sp. ANC 3813 TaxID=1977873 RepID=UPI00148AA97F|nr:MarR family transcriptional regulator [Acinetobacter sp. ANC 3813]
MNTHSELDQLRFAGLASLVARTWRKTIDSRLEKYELTEATWLPLVYLSRVNKPIRQKDLASMLSLDSSSVVRVLNQLEQNGLIERVPEEHDRRAKATSITAQGREIVEHLEQMSQSLEDEIKSRLDPHNFQIAREVLESLVLILDALPNHQALDQQLDFDHSHVLKNKTNNSTED